MTLAFFPGLDGGASSSSSRLRTSVGRRRSDFGVAAAIGPAGRCIVDATEVMAKIHIKNKERSTTDTDNASLTICWALLCGGRKKVAETSERHATVGLGLLRYS